MSESVDLDHEGAKDREGLDHEVAKDHEGLDHEVAKDHEGLDHEVAKDHEGREARRTRSVGRESSRPSRFVSSRIFAASCSQSLRGALRAFRDILYGASIYEMVRDLQKERSQREHLFILVVFGDLLGVPILPPYHTLRLLPYIIPHIAGWRRSMSREKDLTDLCDQEIT